MIVSAGLGEHTIPVRIHNPRELVLINLYPQSTKSVNGTLKMAIPVKINVFEGPLDLLLHLIEKNKIDIYDIPIVEITDQYMEYLHSMEQEDLGINERISWSWRPHFWISNVRCYFQKK